MISVKLQAEYAVEGSEYGQSLLLYSLCNS